MAIIKTKNDLCKGCYSCVRDCPAKAVKVERGQARVVDERCISCGNCARVCSQNAKDIGSQVELVRSLLDNQGPVIALMAPSFPASFYFIDANPLFSLMKNKGFSQIEEVASGVDITIPYYRNLIEQGQNHTIISSHCPAIVALIERQYPQLIDMLAPIDSALLALAKHMKRKHPKSSIVFVGPCIAKKEEAKIYGQGVLDAVLTFGELKELLNLDSTFGVDSPHNSVTPGSIKADSSLFPVPGGFIRNIDPTGSLFRFEDIARVEGKEECIQFLDSLASGKIKPRLVDILFCKGCIDGPGIDSPLDIFARQQLIFEYARKSERKPITIDPAVNLIREFVNRHEPLAMPSDTEIQAILRHTYKTKQEDELNCGSCGYDSCREKAIAVYQGLAEIDMCLPYLLAQSRGEIEYYKNKLGGNDEYEKNLGLVGTSEAMKNLKNLVAKVSKNDATLLLLGESGVGKEVLAKAIHRLSDRARGPFAAINCAALPELLLESELFGYEDGAFTGARKNGKAGRFELAKGGTILLDEIGDIPLTIQAKLLRVLQEREFTKLGGTANIRLDARILAATNKDLSQMVTEGKFRADLFYRLNVITVNIPPLRERKEDIASLIGHFLHKITTAKQMPPKIVTDEALGLMLAYNWPGNIRELENTVERLIYISDGNVIRVEDLPSPIRQLNALEELTDVGPLKDAVNRLERELIIKALKQTGNNRAQAAALLGLHRASFYYKLKEYNID